MAEHKECPFAKELTTENGGMCRHTGYYCTYQYESRCEVKKMHTQKQTNADRIRNMTDEELAEFLDKFDSTCGMCIHQGKCYVMNSKCRDGFLQWLKSEVKE